MLSNLKLIFIHGINQQAANYSHAPYTKILAACRGKLKQKGINDATIEGILQKIIRHEVFWGDLTADLTHRYLQLAYEHAPPMFWRFLTRPVDPLGLEIMYYIKDKGDKKTGKMSILKKVDSDVQRILSSEDLGKEVKPPQAQNVIFVAHSLGTVIGFDYIMGFRENHKINPEVTVRSFITLGSPLPIFTSAMGHPDSDLILPDNVKRWVNILSLNDALARPVKTFFPKIPIEQHFVWTGFMPINAHNGYWNDKRTASLIAEEVIAALEV